MKKPHDDIQLDTERSGQSRRQRLHTLLFTRATLGTTLLTVGAKPGPKLPPFVGE